MTIKTAWLLCWGFAAWTVSPLLAAGQADVLDVQARVDGPGTYIFVVTVRHIDEGWDHYADAWEVATPQGQVLGTRTLYHPHVDEQPFTRSLADVRIPQGVTEVVLRARDSVHGFGGRQIRLQLAH